MKKTALIFDMDGVLVDSEPFHQQAEFELYKQLGMNVPAELFLQFIGMSLAKMWQRLKDDYGLPASVDEYVEMDHKFRNDYFSKIKSIPVIPGIKELLDLLEKNKIPIAIASSSSRTIIEMTLMKSGLQGYFQYIVSGQDVNKGKPEPDIFLKAADLINKTTLRVNKPLSMA